MDGRRSTVATPAEGRGRARPIRLYQREVTSACPRRRPCGAGLLRGAGGRPATWHVRRPWRLTRSERGGHDLPSGGGDGPTSAASHGPIGRG